MGFFNFPEKPEWNQEIRKLETTDKGHADIFNLVFQSVIDHVAFLKIALRNIDGGYFDESVTVEVHNETPLSHAAMHVDGGSVVLIDGVIATSLEEHLVDENAHPNIILDGNNI